MKPDPQESDSEEPNLRESIEQTAEGCYGCIGVIAILLFCVGFFGLRVAFRGATAASDTKVEIRQQDYRTTTQEHLTKQQTDSPHQPTSYRIRIIGGLFGLAATALGAILLIIFGYSFKLQRTPELDKKSTARQIEKSQARNSNS